MIYSREFLANLPEEYKHKCQNIIKEMSPEKFKEFIYKTDNNILPYLFKTEMENFKINSDPSYGVGSKLLYKIIQETKLEDYVIITVSQKEIEKEKVIKEKLIPFNTLFIQTAIPFVFNDGFFLVESIILKRIDGNIAYSYLVKDYKNEGSCVGVSGGYCEEFGFLDKNINIKSEVLTGSQPIKNFNSEVHKYIMNSIKNTIIYLSNKICSKEYRTYYRYENGKVNKKELVYASEVRMHKRHFWEDSGKFIIPTLHKEEILSKGYFIDDLVFKDGELRQNVPYTIIGNYIRNAELEKKNKEIDLIERRHLKQEEKIYSILRELYPDKVIRRHDRKTLNGIELDFNLPEFRLGIEYDGEQHFNKELYEKLYGNGFYEQVKRDRLKDKLCNKKNIKLIRIKYNEPITLSYIKKRLS